MPWYNETIMELLHIFAQSTRYYDYSSSSRSSEDVAVNTAAALIALLFAFIVFAVIYAYFAFCLMNIFKKAGVPKWIAWVPFYNNWKLLEIGGQQGFWAVLAVIPFVNVVAAVFMLIAQYHIGKKLGKGGEFVLWAIFLPVVWYPWLAFDKSTWNETGSTAPSLHRG